MVDRLVAVGDDLLLPAAVRLRFHVDASKYPSPHAAMAAVPAGGRIFFPPGTYALGGASLTAAVNGVHVDAAGATFTVDTWGVPAFDLLDVHGWTLDIGLVQYVGTRGTHTGASVRGQAPYTLGCGVYTNGDRHHVRQLRTIGMPTPVNLSSWDGASAYGRQGVANRIGRLECEGYDFGVLWVNQRDLVIEDLYAHDDIDDSSGANPTHAYYASGSATARSVGVTVKKARCENNDGGHAFQLKYADQVTLGPHRAHSCAGIINVMDCDDLSWLEMSGTALLTTGGLGGVAFGYTTAPSKRPVLRGTSVTLATGVNDRAVAVWADDAEIDGMSTRTDHGAGDSTAEWDVILRGASGRVRGLTMRSVGAAHRRGVALGYGSTTVSGWVLDSPITTANRSLVDVLVGSSGNTVRYDPAAQTITAGGAAVGTTGGTATGNEVSIVTLAQVALTPFGESAGIAALINSTVIVPVANNGIQCLVTPRRDIAVSSLLWFSTTASGNYDIAIVDDALSTRLWSKGSTAWPAAGTITETVTGVTMRAGRTYRLVFSADNATGALRGAQASATDTLIRMDGLYAAYLTSGLFPVGTNPGRGSTGSTRVPLIIVRGS